MKILTSILILLFFSGSTFAHTCLTYARSSDAEHSQELRKMEAIFFGEVVSVSEPLENQDKYRYGSQSLKIKVLRTWKGSAANELTVLYTHAYLTFEEEIGGIGTKKIFYAYKIDDPDLHVNSCSFTLFDDEKMKREFGAGKILLQSATDNPKLEPNGFWTNFWRQITSIFS